MRGNITFSTITFYKLPKLPLTLSGHNPGYLRKQKQTGFQIYLPLHLGDLVEGIKLPHNLPTTHDPDEGKRKQKIKRDPN